MDATFSFVDPFVKKAEEYTRDVDIRRQCLTDYAHMLSRSNNVPIESVKQWLRAKFGPGGELAFKDREFEYTERQENGDRKVVKGGFYAYIMDAARAGNIISPTFTTYTNPLVKESIYTKYIKGNIKGRKIAKHEMFIAKQAGNSLLAEFKNGEQGNYKVANNSISGGHVSSSTPLYNASGHPTLTSNCRVTSGYGNLNNEKLTTGNRHYWNVELVLNNLAAISTHADLPLIESVVKRYQLHVPTADEVLECIEHSTSLYWSGRLLYEPIIKYVNGLTDVERCAFVYISDFYHLAKHNPGFMRMILDGCAVKATTLDPTPTEVWKAVPETVQQLVIQIWHQELKGVSPGDVPKHEMFGQIAATARHVANHIQNHTDFVHAFLRSDVMHHDVANLPMSIRRCVPVSDTDSSIATVKWWIKWRFGNMDFTPESITFSQVMVYFLSSTVIHLLAMLSKNMGVATTELFTTQMKNEFRFDVFFPTFLTKHYWAIRGAQEGNVFKEHQTEIKGSNLRSSNVPEELIDQATVMMRWICDKVFNNEKLVLRDMIRDQVERELHVRSQLLQGNLTYYRQAQIKTPKHYNSEPDRTPYFSHMLWTECFAGKYGHVAEPPYGVVKISTTLTSAREIQNWLNAMSDQDLATRIREFLKARNKDSLGTIYFNLEQLRCYGIPKEIQDVIDTSRVVREMCSVFYIIFETLGVSVDRTKILFSEMY